MSILSEATEIPRKTMIMFFLIDTSGSMEGEKIASLNDAMRETIPDIKDISDGNADALIKIAVLDFASGTEWITPLPQDFDTFRWQDLEAGGVTDLGEACLELNSKLNRNSFLQDKVGNYAPVIILMSDGAPTDDFNGGLAVLKQNKWFGAAIKIALSIGQDADNDVLAEFTGNRELVIPIQNKAAMKRMIRFVSVTSSRIGSAKAGDGFGHEAKEQQIVAEIQAERQELDPEENIDEGW
ncbi:VWA domain-containing protein [Treponema sp. OMZ 787]|uniref:vWA domain-containing protein n=1 Tax=Treponema sp. OMZ 787 TaxID=2563669 RepID=UPI0020A274E7|nr:VWA domain-containing protein [Treponema sp. OMZ 787]UTC63033.1 VWA domain-containing protein [Treponema sp. OMZ 787]